eukprot:Sspe_Gene.76798::Locus_47976_Transcript_1_1_Confidence_1.000_Length_2277::g.76798::m.76798
MALDLSPDSYELDDSSGHFPPNPWKGEREPHLVDNYHEHDRLQPFSRYELHALAFPRDVNLVFLIEEDIEYFVKSCPYSGLRFPPMISFHRRLVSECASRHGLLSMSLGDGEDRYVVVYGKENAFEPMLHYWDAIPTNMNKDKLMAAHGCKRRVGRPPQVTETVPLFEEGLECLSLVSCEYYRPYHASKQHDVDRVDWMRLVHETVRKGLPVATHAHIVEVRMTNTEDTGQYAELQRFLGPFNVRWLDDDRHTGIGIIVYPSVPAANNCLDRFEDEYDTVEDTDEAMPFHLYPFAAHVFGPYIHDQAIRRFQAEQSGTSTPIGRSPSSTSGSWREASTLERHMESRGRWGQTPPLIPKDQGTPTLSSGSPNTARPGWSPATLSRKSPGLTASSTGGETPSSAHESLPFQPLNLGQGRWQELQKSRVSHADPEPKHSIEISNISDKVTFAQLLDLFQDLDVVGHQKTQGPNGPVVVVSFATSSDAVLALKYDSVTLQGRDLCVVPHQPKKVDPSANRVPMRGIFGSAGVDRPSGAAPWRKINNTNPATGGAPASTAVHNGMGEKMESTVHDVESRASRAGMNVSAKEFVPSPSTNPAQTPSSEGLNADAKEFVP